ncbi:hypothetical protein [Streptomyces sp. NPDC058280]|uniref:hypothetical protein n=1 Tax=Streptomyces sp. NPDC058280 TaxID=3346419 RepID=UPI0036E6A6FE
MSAANVSRIALGALGVLALGFGGYELLDRTRPGDPTEVALWLAGAVALHDGLLVPLVLGAGLLLGRTRLRTVLRGGLLTAGCLTLLALPLLLRPGKPDNPSVLPLDYPVNWAVALGITALATACAGWATRRATPTEGPTSDT